jgi:hypothetical protein
VSLRLVIQNPDQKDVSIKIDHQGNCTAPAGVAGDWVQQELTLVDQETIEKYSNGTISSEEYLRSILVFEAHGQRLHAGSKVYTSRRSKIDVHIDWQPPEINAKDFFPENLKYSIGCTARLDIHVSGLK